LSDDSHPIGPSRLVVSPKRESSPVGVLTSGWVLHTLTSVRWEGLMFLLLSSFLKRLPSGRGPPLLS
jgi:hypothetical protein